MIARRSASTSGESTIFGQHASIKEFTASANATKRVSRWAFVIVRLYEKVGAGLRQRPALVKPLANTPTTRPLLSPGARMAASGSQIGL